MSHTSSAHVGELKLRQIFSGEMVAEETRTHAASCAECQAKLSRLGEEQAKFEAAIPFERFAAGVERAQRTPRTLGVQARRWQVLGLALAAMVAAVVGVKVMGGREGGNRLKGGGLTVKVASALGSPQRDGTADPQTPEALLDGERIRLGVKPGETERYVLVVSLDEKGEVTPLYPEAGKSLPLGAGRETQYLPDSVVFTGHGLERVVVVLSDTPLSVQQVAAEARARYDEAHGNLMQLGNLDVPGEQFHRTFLKP
jgi:hypothetical protein